MSNLSHSALGALCAALGVLQSAGCELHFQADLGARDATPPAVVRGLASQPVRRDAAVVAWRAPADGDVVGYRVWLASEPLSSRRALERAAAVAAPGARGPAGEQRVEIGGLRPGQPYYLAVVAVDAAGNESAIESVGPIVTDFAVSGARHSPRPEDGDNALGFQIARGHFDGDDYGDVAVAAPFKQVGDLPGAGAVYLYFGGPDGIGDAPDVVLEGSEAYAQLGNGLAVLDWDGDGLDDVAVGAPFADGARGAAYVFHGGGALTRGPVVSDAAAELRIAPGDGAAAGAFGFTLVAGRFDRDRRDDLAIGAVAGAGGDGAVVLLHGGDHDGPELRIGEHGVATLIADPSGGSDDLFGVALANLGRTGGADDVVDELAVARYDSSAVFVYRGRPARPSGVGLHPRAFDPRLDLEITADEEGAQFAAALGSVARGAGRALVVGAYRSGDDAGRALLLDAGATGVREVAEVVLAEIEGEPGLRFGSAVASNGRARSADVDGDGLEDLVIVGGRGAVELFVWFGGALPEGRVPVASAAHSLVAPGAMQAEVPSIGGSPMTAAWIGDVDGDGLEDLAWADWAEQERDGVFEVLR